VKWDFRGLLGHVLACSSRLRLVGQYDRPRRDTYARRVGSSVHEGHGLLNGETGRAVACAQVERECHAAPAVGVTSWNRSYFRNDRHRSGRCTPHTRSGRPGISSGSGQASVFAVADRTRLGRSLVDGRYNHSDCPLDNFRSFLLALGRVDIYRVKTVAVRTALRILITPSPVADFW
jgi:hypothetical protein